MDDFDDTLRLPAADYSSIRQKWFKSGIDTHGKRMTLPTNDLDEGSHLLVSDTIPKSKVTLPIIDDEIETTYHLPAIVLSSVTSVAQQTSTARIDADRLRVILARTLRMFGYGFTSVLIGATLATAGLSLVQVSLLLTTALIGSVVAVIFVTLFADRLGRRRVLVCFALLMAVAGLAFTFSHNLVILLLAAFFGTINPSSSSENTPFIAIEQAILPQTCAPGRRTVAFSHYNLAAQLAGAIGGLAVTLPDILHRFTGVATGDGVHTLFAIYALLGITSAVLYMGMTENVEPALKVHTSSLPEHSKPQQELRPFASSSSRVKRGSALPVAMKRRGRFIAPTADLSASVPSRTSPANKQSRSIILRLASLFALDAFAGGLVVQTILAFWFEQRFGISLSTLGLLFFGTNLLAALSLPIAARLSKRFGLLNTMVFTHLPSQILLVLVPVMPTFWLAAFFLLCRQSLSKMDVPTRQAYIMELVVPEERTSAAGITTLARSVATSVSPLVAGTLMTGSVLVLGVPFLLAGSLSALYDLILYGLFRKVPVEEI